MITIDGSRGEGGGQIVRTAVTLSVITGTPVMIENIRARRSTPGLRAQHVTAIQAAATLCEAQIDGVQVGSSTVLFEPGGPVQPGEYEWTIGTAGAVTLVMQTLLLPLALANGPSKLVVRGGTHVSNSPSGHYLRDVFVPAVLGLGAHMEVYVDTTGWMPEGGGVMTALTRGKSTLTGRQMVERGPLERIFGTAVGCNLPSHIPQRMANRAVNLLERLEVDVDIRPIRTRSLSTGAGLFLAAEYNSGRGGAGSLGRKGIASEVVAERAVTSLLEFEDSGAAVDVHLADQLVLPMALAQGPSAFSTPAITPHLRTNLDVIRAFLPRPIILDEDHGVVRFE